jgi:WD40 repeat protein
MSAGAPATASTAFFATGGAVPLQSPSYCVREADRELYESLLRGEFCYILTTRQIGKTSLTARTAERLRADGLDVAFLDLTEIGLDCTKEQWYYTLLSNIGEDLDLRPELRSLWTAEPQLAPLQRWLNGIRMILRTRPARRLAIFIDEIDYVRGLSFETAEFFAAIRACYNRRTIEPEFNRLTFCLLGVATPSDLIDDVRVTPFNIGHCIELLDLSQAEAATLVYGFQCDAALGHGLLERALHWTGGHPYLTQRLCWEIARRPETLTNAQVDRLCADLFLSPRAQEQDANLTFVRDRLLKSDVDLAALFSLYAQIYRGQRIPHNKANPLVDLLMLSGVIHAERGELVVRNRIYAHVFDLTWIREHMPDAELRRQRVAYHKGILRATAFAAVALAIVGSLTFAAVTQAQRARTEAQRARAEAARADRERNLARNLLYVADMALVQQAYQQGDYGRMAELLEAHRPTSDDKTDRRGFEWRYFWRLMHQDAHTCLSNGDDIVTAVAFSPRGKILASSRGDGTIKLWDSATWSEMATLPGPTAGVFAIAFSPDGRLLASANLDRTVTLWNVATRTAETTLQHRGEVHCVAFSADGRKLATGDDTGELTLWDVASHQLLNHKQACKCRLDAVAFSPDGHWLAAGCAGAIELWPAPFTFTQKPVSLPKGQEIFALAFSPQSTTVAAGRADGSAEIWNIASWSRQLVLAKHKGEVNAIAFSTDGRYLATGSWDNTVRLWNAATGMPIGQPFIGHTNRVTSVAFSPDGLRLVSSGGNEFKVWELWRRERNPCRLTRAFDRPDQPLLFSPAGALCQVIYDRKRNIALLWDIARHTLVMTFPIPNDAYMSALSHDGKLVACGTEQGTVIVRDVASGRQLKMLSVDRRSPNNGIGGLAFSPDDSTLAVSSGDPALATLWDVTTGRQRAHFQRRNSARGIAFSPDGKTLAAAEWQGQVYLWDLNTGKPLASWWAGAKSVNDIAFSPDGKTLATSSDDGTVKLWNVATHREMVTLTGPQGSIASIAFSPDGNQLAAMIHDQRKHSEVWSWQASDPAELSGN